MGGAEDLKLRRIFAALFLAVLFSEALYARPEIRRLSHFTLWRVTEIFDGEGFDTPAAYRTLNHEGGLCLTVLERGRKERGGRWLFVTNTAPFWVEGGDFIERYRRFWIFLPDDAEIFDFEE